MISLRRRPAEPVPPAAPVTVGNRAVNRLTVATYFLGLAMWLLASAVGLHVLITWDIVMEIKALPDDARKMPSAAVLSAGGPRPDPAEVKEEKPPVPGE